MIDSNEIDDKIICIPFNDPTWNYYKDIMDLPPHMSEEINHFFRVYKELEHKETTVIEIKGKDEAKVIINNSIKKYKQIFEVKNNG